MPPSPVAEGLKDYVQVNERIIAFYAKYPEGSLQSQIIELTDKRVVMVARAYRNPDDPRPGEGYSSLEIPGRTTFTRGSEIENCETSAWGRAIAALGFEVKRGIASDEEVRNKRDEGPQGSAPAPRPAPVAQPAPLSRNAAIDEDFDALIAAVPVMPPAREPAVAFGEAPQCPDHNKPMRKNARGWYCPTKVGDKWCKAGQQ